VFLKEKTLVRPSSLEAEKSNNQGEVSILPEDQPNSLIDLVNLLKEIKLRILNKIDKKQCLFQKSLENKVYNTSEKLSLF